MTLIDALVDTQGGLGNVPLACHATASANLVYCPLGDIPPTNGVPIFDVVAATDDRRDVLLSWVHLNLMGNGIVAETLAAEILKSTCPPAEPAEPAAAES